MSEAKRAVGAVLTIGATCVAVAWVAVWSGYPILSNDTAGYLRDGFAGVVAARRPSLYPAFLAGLSPGSLWPALVMQWVIVVWALWQLARAVDPERWRSVLAAGAVVGAASTLPWFAGRLMPDIYAGLAGIGVLLVLLRPPPTMAARLVLLGLVFVACAFHVANVGTVVLAAAGALLTAPLFGDRVARLWRPALAVAGVAVAAAAVLAAVNWSHNGVAGLSSTGHTFTMARLARYGILQQLLDERCDVEAYALCPYRDRLSTAPDHFVFSPASPLHDIGGAEGSRAAVEPMIRDANRYYLVEQAIAAGQATLEQLGLVRLGMGLGPHTLPGLTGPHEAVRDLLPADHAAYLGSRQRSGEVAATAAAANTVLVPAFWAACLFGGALAWWLRRRQDAQCLAFIVGWLVANAAVMGIMNAPFDRYQARVAWLLPVVVAMVATSEVLRRRRARAADRATVTAPDRSATLRA